MSYLLRATDKRYVVMHAHPDLCRCSVQFLVIVDLARKLQYPFLHDGFSVPKVEHMHGHLPSADFVRDSRQYLLAVVSIWPIKELDAWERACQLASARHPVDGGSLIEKVGRVKELHALFLDHAHAEHLAFLLVWDQLSWEDLQGRGYLQAALRYGQ